MSMLGAVNSVAGVKKLDGFFNVSKKEFKQEIATSRVNEAILFIELAKVAQGAGVQLDDQKDIEAQAVEMVRVNNLEMDYDREELKYWTRKEKESGFFGKVAGLTKGKNVHPAEKKKFASLMHEMPIVDETKSDDKEETPNGELA